MTSLALSLLGTLFPNHCSSTHGLSFSQDGRFVWANDVVAEKLGYSGEELVAMHPFMLSPEYQPCGSLSATLAMMKFKTAELLGETSFKWQHQRQDRTLIDCQIHLVSLKENTEIDAQIFAVWEFN